MKLEVGKDYEANDGRIFAIKREYAHHAVYVGIAVDGGEKRFTEKGSCIDDCHFFLTLVCEAPTPTTPS